MSALENVLVGQHARMKSGIGGSIFRTPRTRKEEQLVREKGREMLSFVGIKGRFDDLAINLSYGDQRRVEIARALASDPKLILLDEPTAGMNPNESADAMSLFRRIRDERGITVVLIEHDMRVVMGISEYISVLDYGEKIAEGNPEAIRANTRVVEAYLGRRALEGEQPTS